MAHRVGVFLEALGASVVMSTSLPAAHPTLSRSRAAPKRAALSATIAVGVVLVTAGCRRSAPSGDHAAPSAEPAARAAAPAAASASGSAAVFAPKPTCPEGMARIAGGTFWMGSPEGKGPDDEHPHYKTTIGAYCLDRTEVTVEAYAECVARGACKPARSNRVTCTASSAKRPQRPINCVTWFQARDYCAWRGGRLPTEVEWEFAASAGDDRTYAWGNDPPDGKTCWEKRGACPVASFPPTEFGLYDMTGNLWEWTDDWYGEYPWPPMKTPTKVYRGGSWSRRFEKWMRVRLRNRWAPTKEGAHLGIRCAATPTDAQCPFGKDDDGRCLHGVLEAECIPPLHWNGVRCARRGAPECQAAYKRVPGHGCVLAVEPEGEPASNELDTSGITRARSPEFDEDCQKYQPEKPQAFRLEGGTHAARNLVGGQSGCKNRDVGVGWNSVCCP